jgi:hypothetical protein
MAELLGKTTYRASIKLTPTTQLISNRKWKILSAILIGSAMAVAAR